MMDSTTAKVLMLSCSLSLVGCGRDKPAESARTTSYEDGPEATMTPASGDVSEERAASASALGANPVESLNDAQITEIAEALNEAEVEHAKIAVEKARNDSVKRFAETMIAHHSEAEKDVDQFEDRSGIEGQDSRMLAQLRADAETTEEKLENTDDASFDKLYMLTQVDMHRQALETLDSRLIPNARNADLRRILQNLRPRIESHLEMARAILNTL